MQVVIQQVSEQNFKNGLICEFELALWTKFNKQNKI